MINTSATLAIKLPRGYRYKRLIRGRNSDEIGSVLYYIQEMPKALSEHRSYKCARKKHAVF